MADKGKGPVIRDVSNPAAVGLEWETSTGRYQIVWLRWTARLSLSFRANGTWHTARIDNPDYVTHADMKDKEVKEIMRRFIAAGSKG